MDLDVFINAIKLGRLSHDSQSNRYTFTYTKEWLDRADQFPLSAHIPLVSKVPQNPDQALMFDSFLRRSGAFRN